MITTLVVATPALASPLGATAETSASAQFTGHFGGGYGDADRAGSKYAAKLVQAWASGDAAAVDALATQDVAAALLAFANPGGASWVQTSSRSIAGVTFSSFIDRTQGKALIIGVQDSAAGGDHAAIIARFVDYAMPLVPRGDHTGMDGAERDLGARHTLRSSSFAGSR